MTYDILYLYHIKHATQLGFTELQDKFNKSVEICCCFFPLDLTSLHFFNVQLAEKGKSFVDIQGLTASTMEILLDFVYTETVLVTVENVQELLPAACLLQLKGRFRSCCVFVQATFKFKHGVAPICIFHIKKTVMLIWI